MGVNGLRVQYWNISNVNVRDSFNDSHSKVTDSLVDSTFSQHRALLQTNVSTK